MKEIGPIVPIVTPCDPNGEIDLAGFRSVCKEMLDAGVQGIFVAGSTGRGPWFNLAERILLCKTAAEISQGSVPIISGCMASGLPDMIESAKAFADAGAGMVVVTAQSYFHYNQTELEMIFLEFADASALPVIVYDIPEFTNLKVASETVIRLARHGNIVGFKDSSADFERFNLLIEALKDFPNFILLQGKEKFLMDSLLKGASGFVVSLIHLAPVSFVNLFRAVRNGNIALANRLQTEVNLAIDLVRNAIERRPESSTLFHILNYAVTQRKVCNNLLLPHEKDAPEWLVTIARQAVEVFHTDIPPSAED